MVAAEHRWTHKHLLTVEELSADDIRYVLNTADSFKEVSTRSVKKVPALSEITMAMPRRNWYCWKWWKGFPKSVCAPGSAFSKACKRRASCPCRLRGAT